MYLCPKFLNFSVLFFSNTKLLIFGNFYFIIGKSLNSFNEIFYRIARVRDENFSNIKTGHIHIANPKEDAYIPDLLKITIRLFDREEIIEEIKKC